MKRKRVLALVLAASLTLAALTGCSQSGGDDSASGSSSGSTGGSQEDVVVVQKAEPTTLDPCFSGSTSELQIMEHIFDTFTAYNENNEIIGNVAESWEVSDDGLTWTFKIRDDIYFSDGEQLTADDVKYTFDRTTDPETMATGNYLWVLDGISYESCNVVNDFTVEIKTSTPCPILTTYMADIMIIPEHYYSSIDTTESQTAPMGSGPYVMESWDTANNIVTLKKNPDYWGIEAGICTGDIETLVWKVSTEDSSRVAEMVSGGADVINYVPADMADQISGAEGVEYVSSIGSQRQYIGINQKGNPVLTLKEFRQALNYAFDADSVIKTLRGGVGERVATFVNPPYNDPDCKPYEYDPEKAMSLMDDAGIVDTDGDGIREYNGENINLALSATGRYSKDVEILQAYAQNLQAVGIGAEVTQEDWASFSSELDAKELKCDLFFLGSGSVFEVQTDLTDFLSTNASNYGSWVNEEFDAKMEELSAEFDEDARMQLGYECQQIMREDPPIVFFSMGDNAYGVSDKITWEPQDSGRMLFYNATYNG